MTEEQRIEILNNAKDFFRSEIVISHIEVLVNVRVNYLNIM